MILTKIVKKMTAIETTTAIICDKCGKQYDADNIMELQEFHHVRFTGGYLSAFGDMNSVECDLCQYCLKEMIGDFCRITDTDPCIYGVE